MSQLNIGIIGPGRMAHRFASACNQLNGLSLWSIYARDLTKAKAFARQYHAIAPHPAYDDISAFLADPKLTAVIIATPDMHHAKYAMLAAVENKHMLIEKPLCTDLEQGHDLIKAINATDSKCGLGYHLRWHAGFRALANHIHNNDMGDILHMDIRWGYTFIDQVKWRRSRKTSRWWSLGTLGTHILDIVRWYLLPSCGTVIQSKVITSNNRYQGTDETSLIALKFESGATASIYSSILFSSPIELSLYTSNSRITGSHLTGPLTDRTITINGNSLAFTCKHDLYQKELKDLQQAIMANRPTEVSVQEGLENIKCMLGY
jgi:predicted dehydrogenase